MTTPLLLLGIAFSSAISCLITGAERTTFLFSLLFSLLIGVSAIATRRLILSLNERARLAPRARLSLCLVVSLPLVFIWTIMRFFLAWGPSDYSFNEYATTFSILMGGPEVAIAVGLVIGAVAFVTPPHWILFPTAREQTPPDAHPFLRRVVLTSLGIMSLAVLLSAPNWSIEEAAEKGQLVVVQARLAKEANAGAKARALRLASKNGHLAVVQALLEKGADINNAEGSDQGWSVQENHFNIKTAGKTALILASENGHLDVVHTLLKKGADVNAHSSNLGETALIVASDKGHLALVQALLEKGADINAKINYHRYGGGQTALMKAAYSNHLDVVQALLAKGADVNAESQRGETALIVASQRDNLAIVEVLLANGADVNKKTRRGATALSFARSAEIRSLLVRAGAQ